MVLELAFEEDVFLLELVDLDLSCLEFRLQAPHILAALHKLALFPLKLLLVEIFHLV